MRTNIAIVAAAVSAAVAASFLTMKHGPLWGLAGGIVVGALIAIVVRGFSRRSAE